MRGTVADGTRSRKTQPKGERIPPQEGRQHTYIDHLRQIASDLARRIERGRLLEVGIGHGQLLREIHRINAASDLYGLDISPAIVRRARINLKGIPVDLRAGNVRRKDYASGFFNLVARLRWRHRKRQ